MPERRKNHLDPTIIDELNDLLDNVEKLIDLEKSKLDPELEEKKAIGVSTVCFYLFAKGASCLHFCNKNIFESETNFSE